MDLTNYIAIGTTPTIRAHIKDHDGEPLDFELIDKSTFHFYFKQGCGYTILEKSGEDVQVSEIEESTVSTYLTQEDTLKFVKGVIEIEIRWLFNEALPNGEKIAGKTTVHQVAISPVIKEEVIRSDDT